MNYFGTVQGVGFRATTRSIARTHAVTGWVRNEPDGSVRLEVQGDGDAVSAFLTEVRASMGRLVRQEHAVEIPPVDDEGSFEIRR